MELGSQAHEILLYFAFARFAETLERRADNVSFTFPSEATGLPSAAPAFFAIGGANRAQSYVADAVAKAIRNVPVQTIPGEESFDIKVEISTSYPPFGWYVWKD